MDWINMFNTFQQFHIHQSVPYKWHSCYEPCQIQSRACSSSHLECSTSCWCAKCGNNSCAWNGLLQLACSGRLGWNSNLETLRFKFEAEIPITMRHHV